VRLVVVAPSAGLEAEPVIAGAPLTTARADWAERQDRCVYFGLGIWRLWSLAQCEKAQPAGRAVRSETARSDTASAASPTKHANPVRAGFVRGLARDDANRL
jgi:hypothetical protein